MSIICFVALVVVLSSCLDDDDNATEPIPVAYVSIYHASPDAPGMDVYVDERPVNRLEFTDYTGYLNFFTGERRFKINPFNATNALVDTTLTFADGGFYSMFIVNDLPQIEALTVRDSAQSPASGKAKVRFINLSPDASAFDVAVNDETDPLFAVQEFKDPSNFIEVDAEETSFVLKAAGEGEELVTVSDVDIRAGRFYTIVARGFVNPPAGNNNTLSVEVIRNL
jgi:hypothetical protein